MEDGDAADQADAGNNKEKMVQASSRKEKSVLQSKLTRLAIQIGYGGMDKKKKKKKKIKTKNSHIYTQKRYCRIVEKKIPQIVIIIVLKMGQFGFTVQ